MGEGYVDTSLVTLELVEPYEYRSKHLTRTEMMMKSKPYTKSQMDEFRERQSAMAEAMAGESGFFLVDDLRVGGILTIENPCRISVCDDNGKYLQGWAGKDAADAVKQLVRHRDLKYPVRFGTGQCAEDYEQLLSVVKEAFATSSEALKL